MHRIPPTGRPRKDTTVRTEATRAVARDWGWGGCDCKHPSLLPASLNRSLLQVSCRKGLHFWSGPIPAPAVGTSLLAGCLGVGHSPPAAPLLWLGHGPHSPEDLDKAKRAGSRWQGWQVMPQGFAGQGGQETRAALLVSHCVQLTDARWAWAVAPPLPGQQGSPLDDPPLGCPCSLAPGWAVPPPARGVLSALACPASSLPKAAKEALPQHLSDHLLCPSIPLPGSKACLPTSVWVTKGSAVSESPPPCSSWSQAPHHLLTGTESWPQAEAQTARPCVGMSQHSQEVVSLTT